MREPLAHIEQESRDGRTMIRLIGEIDLSNADELQRQLVAACADARIVVVDLTTLEFMGSEGVRLLDRLSRHLASRGIELQVVAPPTSIAGGVLSVTPVEGLVYVSESVLEDF